VVLLLLDLFLLLVEAAVDQEYQVMAILKLVEAVDLVLVEILTNQAVAVVQEVVDKAVHVLR
jgi:hypothetical protein